MTSIQFDAKVWKQGSSLILTIPKEIKTTYGIKETDRMEIRARLISEKEWKEQQKITRLKAFFPHTASGKLIYKGKIAAYLSYILYRKKVVQMGSLASGDSLDKLPKTTVLTGIIIDGIVCPEAYGSKQEFYSKLPLFKERLSGLEKLELKDEEGNTSLIDSPRFHTQIINGKNYGIKMVEFRAYLKSKK